MLSLLASYCRNQQFLQQILKKSFTPFCLSNQDIRQHINTLIELKEKQLNSVNQLEQETLSLQIRTYENDLDSFLTKYQVHQKQPYYLFRKNLIQLAYYTYYNGQFDLCQKYIENAMHGDYQNHFTGELLKEIFLAELNGIQFRINYHGLEEEFAVKSLTHWRNVIENHSQFYQQWKNNKCIDVDAFFENMENVHLHQYLESLIVVGRLFSKKGVFEKSKAYFEEAQSKILEAIQFIFDLKPQQNEMKNEKQKIIQDDANLNDNKQKTNNKEYIKYYQNQLNNLLVTSFINQIKISIWQKNFKFGEVLLQEIQQKQIANQQQQIQLQILQFDLQFYQGQDNELLEQLQYQIENSIEQQKNESHTKSLFDDYYAFRLKYNLDDQSQQLTQLKFINQSVDKLIEINSHSLEQLILNNSFGDAYQICLVSINLLQQHQFTKHAFWDSLIFSTLLAAYKVKDGQVLQTNLQQVQNNILQKVDRSLQKIIELFELIIELERVNDINQIKQEKLQQIQLIEFEQLLLNYYKQLALEKIYIKQNLKKEHKECYENQIKILSFNKNYYQYNLEEIYEKLLNIKE